MFYLNFQYTFYISFYFYGFFNIFPFILKTTYHFPKLLQWAHNDNIHTDEQPLTLTYIRYDEFEV